MESNEKEAVVAMDRACGGSDRKWGLRQLREQGQVASMNASIQRALGAH
jgi:hypothetical protein